jgi:hypothetical protein
MTTKKNPGLSARHESVGAALAASGAVTPQPATAEGGGIVPISVRLPRQVHESLRQIAFDRRVSIHSLILDGIGRVIREQS